MKLVRPQSSSQSLAEHEMLAGERLGEVFVTGDCVGKCAFCFCAIGDLVLVPCESVPARVIHEVIADHVVPIASSVFQPVQRPIYHCCTASRRLARLIRAWANSDSRSFLSITGETALSADFPPSDLMGTIGQIAAITSDLRTIGRRSAFPWTPKAQICRSHISHTHVSEANAAERLTACKPLRSAL